MVWKSNALGEQASSGVFFYQLEPDEISSWKFVLVSLNRFGGTKHVKLFVFLPLLLFLVCVSCGDELGAVATDNRVKPESDVCVKVTEIQQFITIKKT